MSACISSHGEYSYHECSVDFVCDYCGILDEEALFAALNEARTKVARVEALATWFEAQHNWREWGVHKQIRAALTGADQ